MHNHDDKYPARPGFEPGTSSLQAPVDTNEPSGPAKMCSTTLTSGKHTCITCRFLKIFIF